MLEQIKQAISLLRGVVSVNVKKTKPKEYDITKTAGFREAMDDIEHGRVTHADSVDDMFQQILGYVPNWLLQPLQQGLETLHEARFEH